MVKMRSWNKAHFVTNAHRFLVAWLQKSTQDFFTRVLDHVRAEALVYRTKISKHYGVIKTTRRARHEDIIRVIAEGLYCDWSLPQCRAHDSSAAGGSSGTSSDGRSSSAAGTSSS